jgi:hypothetical protein
VRPVRRTLPDLARIVLIVLAGSWAVLVHQSAPVHATVQSLWDECRIHPGAQYTAWVQGFQVDVITPMKSGTGLGMVTYGSMWPSRRDAMAGSSAALRLVASMAYSTWQSNGPSLVLSSDVRGNRDVLVHGVVSCTFVGRYVSPSMVVDEARSA